MTKESDKIFTLFIFNFIRFPNIKINIFCTWLLSFGFVVKGEIFIYPQYAEPFLGIAYFQDKESKPYVEVRLLIPQKWLTPEPNAIEKPELKADVTVIFFKFDKVQSYDKFFIKVEQPSADTNSTILDIKRYYLTPGLYGLEIIIQDFYAPENKAAFIFKDSLEIAENSDDKSCLFRYLDFLADFKKVDSENPMARHGYLLTPRFHEFYDDNEKILIFYTEFYNSGNLIKEGEKILLRAVIREFLTNKMIKNYGMQEVKDIQPVIPWLNRLNLSTLPAGHYLLEVEAVNKANQTIARIARYFEHKGSASSALEYLLESTPLLFMESVNNRDTIIEYIRFLRPIATPAEARIANNVLKSGDILLMKRFIAAFWQNRNPDDPESAFLAYRSLVARAQVAFGRCKARVYDTDRGRVFLQYGPPNHRAERPLEPNTYPYEIWQYYDLPNQKNRFFVFYDYIGGCNTYELLHSTALSERRNDQWQNWLQRGRRPIDIQATQTPVQSYGSMANDLFINPR